MDEGIRKVLIIVKKRACSKLSVSLINLAAVDIIILVSVKYNMKWVTFKHNDIMNILRISHKGSG